MCYLPKIFLKSTIQQILPITHLLEWVLPFFLIYNLHTCLQYMFQTLLLTQLKWKGTKDQHIWFWFISSSFIKVLKGKTYLHESECYNNSSWSQMGNFRVLTNGFSSNNNCKLKEMRFCFKAIYVQIFFFFFCVILWILG